VIPQFKPVLEEMVGGRLNPLTRGVLAMADHVVVFWLGVGILIVAAVLGLTALASTPMGRRLREALLLRVPVIGQLYFNSILSRMAEAMAVLVGAGCDIPEALRLGAVSSGSEKLLLDSEIVAGRLEQGANILEAGQSARLLPRLFVYSIQLGAQRNELQDNLYSLGEMHADQARVGQAHLQIVLLPLLLMLIGGVIATAVLAMFLPMIQVVTSLSSAG